MSEDQENGRSQSLPCADGERAARPDAEPAGAFTPGPWSVDLYGHDEYHAIIETDEGNGIALVCRLRDARLIAAAPDLLACCQPESLEVAAAQFEADGLARSAAVMRTLAKHQRAAIAKALGPSAQDAADLQASPGMPK